MLIRASLYWAKEDSFAATILVGDYKADIKERVLVDLIKSAKGLKAGEYWDLITYPPCNSVRDGR